VAVNKLTNPCIVRPEIHSGLKLSKFHDFIPQNRTKIESPTK